MAGKLRIGFADIQDATLVSTWSGTPLHILNVLRSRPDVDVETICPMGQKFKRIFFPMKLRARFTKEFYGWEREDLALRYFAAQVESAVRRKNLDVVFSPGSIVGTRLNPTIPSVFWTDANFHGMLGYYGSKMSIRTLRQGKRQEEMALRRAEFSCYASEWAAAGARKFADPERVKVLPFGPNMRIEHTRQDVDAWIAQRRAAQARRCTLLFIGVDWVRKGGKVAVEAARRLNEAGIPTTLRIVGCTPPEPMPPFVELLGFIRKSEEAGYRRLIDLYRTSDIFLLPSRAEAFGCVVSEASAFGLPSIVCETGGLTETVREGVNGFRLSLDDDGTGFAEKARLILDNYDGYAKNAYAEFQNRLNWETSVDQLAGLLKRAAHRGAE